METWVGLLVGRPDDGVKRTHRGAIYLVDQGERAEKEEGKEEEEGLIYCLLAALALFYCSLGERGRGCHVCKKPTEPTTTSTPSSSFSYLWGLGGTHRSHEERRKRGTKNKRGGRPREEEERKEGSHDRFPTAKKEEEKGRKEKSSSLSGCFASAIGTPEFPPIFHYDV